MLLSAFTRIMKRFKLVDNMIFLSTVMDEEETNTDNSVEHYDG